MKNFYSLAILASVFPLFSSSITFAANCKTMAAEAAKRIYTLKADAQAVSSVNVTGNPKNSSNGVSLIVTVNEQTYLVFLTPSQAGPTKDCRAVNYVIEYPYADLMP